MDTLNLRWFGQSAAIAALGGLMSLACANGAAAQTPAPSPHDDGSAGHGAEHVDRAHRGRRGHHRRGRMFRRMLRQLDLSEAQRAEVRTIMGEARAERRSLRESGNREAMHALRQRTRQRIQAVLTPAQRERAQELRAEHGQRFTERRVSRMTRNLNLNETQQEQVRRILAQAQRTREGAQGLSGQERRAAMQHLRDTTRQSIRSVLDSEQQALFDDFVQERQERRGRHRGGRGHGGGHRGF